MPDEAMLRAKAREAVRTGKLPSRRPDRTWGGPGVGVVCIVCGEAVTKDQLEIQVEFSHDGSSPGLERARPSAPAFSRPQHSSTPPTPHPGPRATACAPHAVPVALTGECSIGVEVHSLPVGFTRRLFRIASLNGTAALCSARVTSSFALSALKSRYHETVKFGQVNWFGEKGERTVGESLFLRLREQAP